jgi:hypothetical protein
MKSLICIPRGVSMKISPMKLTPPFARPAATFDTWSQSFADFLGDTAAQRGTAAPQASSFGANGLFGAPVAAGLSPAGLFGLKPATQASPPGLDEGAAPSLPEAPEEPGVVAEEPVDTGGEPQSADPGVTTPAPSTVSAAMPALAPDVAVRATASVPATVPKAAVPDAAGSAAADFKAAAGDAVESSARPLLQPAEAAQSDALVKPEAEIGPDAPGDASNPEPHEPTVLIAGDGDNVDVHVASLALGEIERDDLRRLTARAVADHGGSLGDLYLNGERLTAARNGGIDGHRG